MEIDSSSVRAARACASSASPRWRRASTSSAAAAAAVSAAAPTAASRSAVPCSPSSAITLAWASSAVRRCKASSAAAASSAVAAAALSSSAARHDATFPRRSVPSPPSSLSRSVSFREALVMAGDRALALLGGDQRLAQRGEAVGRAAGLDLKLRHPLRCGVGVLVGKDLLGALDADGERGPADGARSRPSAGSS